MFRHSPIFWVALFSSLATGIYGFITNQEVLAIPYTFINPSLLFLITSLKKFESVKRRLEILAALVIFLNIPGSVYLHRIGFQYDIILHFFVSFAAFQTAYLILPLLLKKPYVPRTTAALITIAGGFIFEGVQKLSDTLFSTALFFDIAQSTQLDFIIDILVNILGVLVGAIFLKFTSAQSSSQAI